MSRRPDGEPDFSLNALTTDLAVELDAAFYSWNVLTLSTEDANRLRRELEELNERWTDLSGAGTRHVLRLALSPFEGVLAAK